MESELRSPTLARRTSSESAATSREQNSRLSRKGDRATCLRNPVLSTPYGALGTERNRAGQALGGSLGNFE
jgi:hypothetical protein